MTLKTVIAYRSDPEGGKLDSWWKAVSGSVPAEYLARARIEIEFDHGDPCICVSYQRPETEVETRAREMLQQARDANTRAADLKQLAILKARYEK